MNQKTRIYVDKRTAFNWSADVLNEITTYFDVYFVESLVTLDDMKTCLNSDRKLHFVKHLRALTGFELIECKHLTDAIFDIKNRRLDSKSLDNLPRRFKVEGQ